MDALTDRERLLRVLDYQDVDRGVYGVHTSPWPETLERWKSEGLPAAGDLSAWSKEHFPDRDIIGIPAFFTSELGGMMHCVTQQQPAVKKVSD